MFYPPLRHRSFIGTRLYDDYGLLFQAPVPSRITSPRRLGLKVSQLHRPRIDGPSPGKIVASCLRPPTFSTSRGYGKSIGLRWSTAPRPPLVCLPKVRSRLGGDFGLRLPSDPSLAPVCQLTPSWGNSGSFFGHPCLRLPVPFSQGPGLDLHPLADYHAGHTTSNSTLRSEFAACDGER